MVINSNIFKWKLFQVLPVIFISLFIGSCDKKEAEKSDETKAIPLLEKISEAKPRNVIFILSDDHRYDFMEFTGKVPDLDTPNMNKMAREGVHVQNAFVSTSLCSPSRASILTGLYAHSHTVIDNHAPAPEELIYFPQYLQKQGYETAFIGKWHMGGGEDDPRLGFDHWISFKGQGTYYNPNLNVNGERVIYSDSAYVTDVLTDYALEWLEKQTKNDKPFFLYLSHKAVHSEFQPAQRHKNLYDDVEIHYPESMYLTAPDSTLPKAVKNKSTELETERFKNINIEGIPEWVKEQRYSWHGVDYMYHGQLEFEEFYQRYLETLLGVDESIGKVLEFLERNGLDENTVVIYMGDNGFSFGEHGLIDKRHMYEESIRVPLLVKGPDVIMNNSKISEMVMNIDVAPTILGLAGLKAPEYMQGKSFLPLIKGEGIPWRDKIFYEYYWEYDFPQTPTMHGVRTDRYKYIRYHGLWGQNEFYDLQEDPHELNNLIASPEHQELIEELANEIYDWLEETGGMQIPLKRTVKHRFGDYKFTGQH